MKTTRDDYEMLRYVNFNNKKIALLIVSSNLKNDDFSNYCEYIYKLLRQIL